VSAKFIDILDDSYECQVFTVSGDRALDYLVLEHLRVILAKLKQDLGADEMVALILGGGYGRGEGGAFKSSDGFKPYNDYDLVLIHRAESYENLNKVLRRIHQVYSEQFQIHVDITPIKAGALEKLPHALTWYELYHGHQVLYGLEDALDVLSKRKLDDLPDTEWGRLLVNRGSGLVFTLWAHQGKSCSVSQNETFEQFAIRQIEKAWLALGDTWLASKKRYDTRVINRRENWLAFRDEVPGWSENYLNAIEFKLNPVFKKSRHEIIHELSILADLYSSALNNKKSSLFRPLVGFYYTLKNISSSRWLLSNPFYYPRERMRRVLVQEFRGYTLTRRRLIGSTENYIKLWEKFG